MADIAFTRIIWLNQRHPVDIPGGVRAKLDAHVEITNGGSPPGGATWTSPAYHVRGHLLLHDGRSIQDPMMEGIDLPSSIPMGATFQHTVSFLSEPATQGVTAADLLHPDTSVIVDVVREGVAWLGGNPPGDVGQMRISDGLRDRKAGLPFVETSTRQHFRTQAFNCTAVPKTGLENDILFFQVPNGKTVYLLQLALSATGGNETVNMYLLRAGNPEIFFHRFRVNKDETLPFDLKELRVDPGDWVRFAVLPNPDEEDGGEITAHVEMVDFPWEDT
jgi:hypothetical protein